MKDDSDSETKGLEEWSLTKGKRVYIPDDSPRSRMIFKNRKAQLKLEEFYAKSHKERIKNDRSNPTISP